MLSTNKESYTLIKGKPNDFTITFFVGHDGNIRSSPQVFFPKWDIINDSYLVKTLRRIEDLVYELSNSNNRILDEESYDK